MCVWGRFAFSCWFYYDLLRLLSFPYFFVGEGGGGGGGGGGEGCGLGVQSCKMCHLLVSILLTMLLTDALSNVQAHQSNWNTDRDLFSTVTLASFCRSHAVTLQ